MTLEGQKHVASKLNNKILSCMPETNKFIIVFHYTLLLLKMDLRKNKHRVDESLYFYFNFSNKRLLWILYHDLFARKRKTVTRTEKLARSRWKEIGFHIQKSD